MDQLGHVIANFQAQLTTKINIGDTTATIDKNTDADGEEIPNGKYFLTVDVDSSRKEHYACTLTRTADGSTLTDLKTLNRTTGEETSGSLRLHRIGAKVVITDFATILKVALKMSGQEGINPSSPMFYTSVPTLSAPEQFATVQYVLDVAAGGSLSFDKQTLSAQTAGEDGILVNDVVYFKESDAKWYKVKADDTTTFQGVRIGFSQTIADENDPMQVVISGPVNAFTGLTPGAKYYASDTAGLVTTTPGTNSVFVGWALSASIILMEIPEKLAMQGGGTQGIPSSTNPFITTQGLVNFGDGSDGDVTISSPTTLTRDMYYNNLVVTDTLTTNGFIIFVKGTLSGSGTIKVPDGNSGGNGGNGSAGAGGASGTAGSAYTTGRFQNIAGVPGGAGSRGDPGNGSTGITSTHCIGVAGAAGGNGGNGGNSGNGPVPGGVSTGGLKTNPLVKIGTSQFLTTYGLDININGTFVPVTASAGAGGGGSGGSDGPGGGDPGASGGGGGSGASGGIIWISAFNWTGTFTIRAVGGNGGNAGTSYGGYQQPGGSGGGAGGAGGISVVIYGVKTWTGSYVLSPGTGGTGSAGAGSGGAGTNGSNGPAGVPYEFSALSLI